MRLNKFLSFLIFTPLLLISCSGSTEMEESIDVNDSLKVTDSLSYFQERLKANPDNPMIIFERAKYYINEGEIELAVADLENVLKQDSTHIRAHRLYADINLAMLDIETSKLHYEFILDKDSTDAKALLGLSKIYAALSNFAKADYYISASLQSDPYSAEPYFTRGLIYRSDYYETGRVESWDIAKSSFQTAIEQEPNYYAAYIELGVMHSNTGDSIALEYYNSALDIYPESIEAWYNKGFYYQQRGEVDNALGCFWKLRAIDSTWYKPCYNIGYIHLIMTDEFDSAIYYFDKCTFLDPTNYEAYNNLGYAWQKKGDLLNAKKYYQKAIEVNPDYQLAKDNLNDLQ
jgi:tetratricopeptide (TPR) repeat protein